MTQSRDAETAAERPVGTLAEQLAGTMTAFAGSTTAFGLAVATIVVWAVTGPVFGYSDTWQLVINTGTTVVTFLMVFLIQRTQNKDALAIQLKLNEIVAAIDGASNRLINVEDLTEGELQILSEHYHRLADMAKSERQIGVSHSVEEARARHERKHGARGLG
ncbi:MAG: low affinity iron permease family protein [Deltaproteobacteria bacterium]|nr:MAG: low affinity iron permease family protein [Deltaproteobacteria bacterium]